MSNNDRDLIMEHTLNDPRNTKMMSNKWYISEELMKETPSVLRGMEHHEEMARRRRGVRFIKYMMRYLTFEKIIQGKTLDETKTPRVFPTAVHMFHRFYTLHPLQFFNEYVTAVACVFHSAKIEEHIMPINRILDLARINGTSLPWVKLPEELSFSKPDWAALWKNEVSETEFLLFTTVNPMRFLFINVYGYILIHLKKWVGFGCKEEEAVKVRDRSFLLCSDVYSCGSHLVVTQSCRMIATMCIMMSLKHFNMTISNWKGKTKEQQFWFQESDPSLTIERLKKMELEFLAHLKQYNLIKSMDDKSKVKVKKGVSPSSDYGSEGSVTSNPVSPSDSMCSDRDVISNEPTSPAASTASSSDQGLASEGKDHIRRPVVVRKSDLAPPCQISLSVGRDFSSSSSASSSSVIASSSSSSSSSASSTTSLISISSSGKRSHHNMSNSSSSTAETVLPIHKKLKLHSPVRYP